MTITFHITSPRSWAGNGFGYDAAEWEARDQYGKPIAAIVNWSGYWHVTDQATGKLLLKYGNTLKEAKEFCRAHLTDASSSRSPREELNHALAQTNPNH